MAKIEPFSRGQLRLSRRAWARRHLRPLAVVVGALAGFLLLFTVVVALTTPEPFDVPWFSLGLAFGGGPVALVLGLGFVHRAHDAHAVRHLRGAIGKQSTRTELDRARRRRLVWGWVDALAFQHGDLDHVVLTRRGGVVVIDSQWRTELSAPEFSEIVRSGRQAAKRAETLLRSIRVAESGRPRVRPSVVTPLVVVWGRMPEGMPEHSVHEGVHVVHGHALVRWLRTHRGETVDRRAALDVVRRLEDWRDDQRLRAAAQDVTMLRPRLG